MTTPKPAALQPADMPDEDILRAAQLYMGVNAVAEVGTHSIIATVRAILALRPAQQATRTTADTLREIKAASCKDCGASGYTDPGEADSPDGPGRPAVVCGACMGTGWRDGVHISDQQATPEPVGEPVATVTDWVNGSYSRKYTLEWHRDVPKGSRLYSHPTPAPQQVPMTGDAARLDWMATNEAHIGWNREGDVCRVWAIQDEEKGAEPLTRWHANARSAIDEARGITAQAKVVQT